ncbi:MAG: hypothetical protein QXH51_07640 [Candidatus Bathyarchaeia archaeon]
MSWRDKVNLSKPEDRPPIIHLQAGDNPLEIVEEPDEPIPTKYGPRLPFIVKPLDSGDRYTLMVTFRPNVGENSLLGQLKKIADQYGGLKGLKLNITCNLTGGVKRYRVQVLEKPKSKTRRSRS